MKSTAARLHVRETEQCVAQPAALSADSLRVYVESTLLLALLAVHSRPGCIDQRDTSELARTELCIVSSSAGRCLSCIPRAAAAADLSIVVLPIQLQATPPCCLICSLCLPRNSHTCAVSDDPSFSHSTLPWIRPSSVLRRPMLTLATGNS